MKKFFKFIGIALLVIIGLAIIKTVVEKINENIVPVILLMPVILGIVPLIIIISNYKHNPFASPYKIITINVSGRRNVTREDIMDEFLMSDNGNSFYRNHAEVINWKQACESIIENSVWKKHRRKQFESIINDSGEFTFRTVRTYTKGAYSETVADDMWGINYDHLSYRNAQLSKINYCMTLSELAKAKMKKAKADKKKEILANL